MGGKSSPSPDIGGVMQAMASAQAANQAYALGQQQLAFTQQQWNQTAPQMQEILSGDISAQQSQLPAIQAGTNEYVNTFLPLENKFVNQAENWDTPAQEAVNAGAAQGNVANQYGAALSAAQSQLEGFGVDPTSTRYGALTMGAHVQQGAAEAAAGTSAIQNTKLQGLGLEQAAMQAGQGVASSAIGQTNASSSAGQSGTGTGLGSVSTMANALSSPTAWFNTGAANMGTFVNAVNGFNYAQNQAAQIQNQASAGFGSLAGGILGGAMSFLDEGGPTSGIPTPPMNIGPTTGGGIPTQSSPSQGQTTDDVPARLTAGEFVVPRDVVAWEGEKSLYGLIDKARKGQQQSQQRTDIGPQRGQAIPQPPTFQSRPMQQGIPVGMH